MTLEEEVKLVQAFLNVKELSKKDQDIVAAMILRIASYQPSPSKLNALSILKSNPAERVARHLAEWESTR